MAEIMVISRGNLFENDSHFLGFQSPDKGDFIGRILHFPQWLDRDVAEKDSLAHSLLPPTL